MRRLITSLVLAVGLVGSLHAQAGEAPVNDDFENAISMSTLPFLDTQDLSGATLAGDGPESVSPLESFGPPLSGLSVPPQCHMYNTVWYRWTVSKDGWYSFDTELTDDNVDTMIGFYEVRGTTTWENLEHSQCIDNSPKGKNTFFGSSFRAGRTYAFQVGLRTKPDPNEAVPVTVRFDEWDYCGSYDDSVLKAYACPLEFVDDVRKKLPQSP